MAKISNPFSTGNGGGMFETKVQAAFLTLMACQGTAPSLPQNPISKIKFQGRNLGFHTDDLIVYAKDSKLLIQIKHTVTISKGDSMFKEILKSAWHDFNNTKLFNKRDNIVLVTKYLSKTDIDDTLVILDWAKTSSNSIYFYDKVKKANFSSDKKKKKLQAFLVQIKSIDKKATDENIFNFLRCFYLLGFDLDIVGSINKILLDTLLSQYYDGQAVFDYLQTESQECNKNAGDMEYDTVISKLEKKGFTKKQPPATIPDELRYRSSDDVFIDDKKELALANLIGSWDENNENDKSVIADIIGENYHQWIQKIRVFLHQKDSPITLHNGIWNVSNRVEIFSYLAKHIYDDELDRLKRNVLNIFQEKDPKFELKISERYLANIKNKIFKNSASLRQGIAETVAIIGNNNDKLIHCDFNKRMGFSWLIRDIFQDADWILWGSLDRLLPVLAQANPAVFLKQTQEVITKKPKLFIELFKQEGGIMLGGSSEITGLLWALEALAWDKDLFAQSCMVFAGLAMIDPGGRMINRPKNSLSTILLPWLPRTNASIKKRKNLVEAMTKEYPLIAWDLLLALLPNQQQSSMQTYKSTWLNISINEEKFISKRDYWEQCDFYTDLIVSIAKYNIDKLIILVKDIDHLTEESFKQLLKQISSSEIIKLPEERRLPLYFSMIDLIREHTKYQKTNWAISVKKIKQIEKVAEKLKPIDLFNLHQRLFVKYDSDLYEVSGDFEKQYELLANKRQKAIKEIFTQNGLNKLIEFSLIVENSNLVGNLLSQITNINEEILSKFLTAKDKKKDFIYGYVYKKYQDNDGWLDSLNVSKWNDIEKANLLKNVGSDVTVWQKVLEWLGDKENLYWDEISFNPCQYTQDEFTTVIDKLLEYHRPNTAIYVLQVMIYKKFPLDVERSVKALLAFVEITQENKFDVFDLHNTLEVIKSLQDNSKTLPDDLFSIEWAYLAVIKRVSQDFKPTTLENKMATDPDFFCELMQHAFRSDNDTSKKKLNLQEENTAKTSYNLLHHWKTIPGFTDGNFSKENFNNWLKLVKDKCKKSGRLDIALQIIGKTLTHTPKDESGLWINKTIAKALNDEESEHLGMGFSTGIWNSRGVHWVDPTGAPEDELANKYLQQANELESEGYINFAKILKEISTSYNRDADRVRNENQ